MALCALSIQSLITSLQVSSTVKLCWFADDEESRDWVPLVQILANDKKQWIIAKPDEKESLKDVFKKTDISETMERKNHVRAR